MLFSLFWLTAVIVLTLATWGGAIHTEEPSVKWVLLGFVAFGVLVVYLSYRRHRRRKSLRIEEEDGTAVYVWVELDGSVRRSRKDPRDDWDGEDGDGGGDGGGD